VGQRYGERIFLQHKPAKKHEQNGQEIDFQGEKCEAGRALSIFYQEAAASSPPNLLALKPP